MAAIVRYNSMNMKKELTRISPFRAGALSCIVNGIIGIVFMPIYLLMAMFSRITDAPTILARIVSVLWMPIYYAIFGFLAGIIGAAIYNLVATWVGGLEFEIKDTLLVNNA
jgi:hypothetical protein